MRYAFQVHSVQLRPVARDRRYRAHRQIDSLLNRWLYFCRDVASAATAAAAAAIETAEPKPGFWNRRLVSPILRLLTQGVTPRKISFTLSLSTVCSLFPFLGFTSLLNLLVGLPLKLNQPIMQTLNQLLTPIHLVMILGYVRLGEWIWGASEHRFSVVEMVQSFADLSLAQFLAKFGWAGVHAFTAWILTAPLVFAVIYFTLRPIINRFAKTSLQGTTP